MPLLQMRKRNPKPSKATQKFAMYIAMVVRNEMEDFHAEHLSDDQMRELNPIIRNAICTALHAAQNYETSPGAKNFVDFQKLSTPDYWEKPTLTDDYLSCEKYFAEGNKRSIREVLLRKPERR
jgi:hypothetical protein